MRLLPLLVALILSVHICTGQTSKFRAIVMMDDSLQLNIGEIIFPLSKDTMYVDTSGIIHIDLTKENHRVFYYAWGEEQSRIYRFPKATVADTLVTIRVPDYQYYADFVARKKCPVCLSGRHVVPILYGYPSPKMFRKSDAGKISLGGCILSEYSPRLYCKKDDFRF